MTAHPKPSKATTDQTRQWATAVRKLQWHLYLRDMEPWRADVLACCKSLTRGDSIAQDLAQETLMRGFQVVAQLSRNIDNPRSFLLRIAKNLWIDRQRNEKRARAAQRRDFHEPEPDASQAYQLAQGLSLVTATLPRRERQVFVLRELLGYTGPEIAEALGTTPAAAKMAASRARRRMRDATGPQGS